MRHTLSYLCPGCNRYGSFDVDDPDQTTLFDRSCQYCGHAIKGYADPKTGVIEKEKVKPDASDDGRAVSRSKRKSR